MNKRHFYNYEYLQEFCLDNKIHLLEDYTKICITRDSRIKGKCITQDCIYDFEKTFRNIIENSNGFCKKCTAINRKIKVENTNLQNHGVKHAGQIISGQIKKKETNQKKYNCDFATQSPEVKLKIKNTNYTKNNGKFYIQTIEGNNNLKKWCLCHDIDNPSQLEYIKQLKKDTCFQNYGVKNPSQNEDIKQLKKDTCLKNWGVEHPCQNPEILQKSFNSGCKFKDYTLPSGKIIKYQGYENFALDELLQHGILEDDIVNDCADVPKIWYNGLDKKEHRYYVDLFIPQQNKCIEVKSTYTITQDNETIKLKQQAVKDAGYACEIWVYNGKGEKVECYK